MKQSQFSKTISAPVSIPQDYQCCNLPLPEPSVFQSTTPWNNQCSNFYTPEPSVFQPLYSRIINSPVYILQDNHYSSLPHLSGPSILQSLYLGTIIVPVVYSPNHQCSILPHSETISSPVSIPQDHQCSSLPHHGPPEFQSTTLLVPVSTP